jgi:hypothetical protein
VSFRDGAVVEEQNRQGYWEPVAHAV